VAVVATSASRPLANAVSADEHADWIAADVIAAVPVVASTATPAATSEAAGTASVPTRVPPA
jgi:hypothetical protein